MEKKHKIALVTYSLSSGGLERMVSNLSVLLDKLGAEVHIYVVNSDVSYPYSGQLFIFSLDHKSVFKKLETYYSIKSRIKKEKYDLILDHRFRLNVFSEWLWQKVIYKNQEVYNFIHSSAVFEYIFKNPVLNNWLFRNKKLIAVSRGITSIVQAAYPDLNINTLYNAISVGESALRPVKDKYIVAIARMDDENVKQVDVLLECFSKSKLAEMGFKLVIIGDGSRMEFMKSFSEQLNISRSIVFTGFLSDPYPYVEHAYFTVLTSKYEGLPTVLIESLMLGVPVISFDCKTGPDEIIVPFQNGILVEDQNKQEFTKAMNRLVDDVELYEYLRSNTTESVRKFSMEEVAKQWQSLLVINTKINSSGF